LYLQGIFFNVISDLQLLSESSILAFQAITEAPLVTLAAPAIGLKGSRGIRQMGSSGYWQIKNISQWMN